MLEIRCEMWHVEEVKGCHNVEFICVHSYLSVCAVCEISCLLVCFEKHFLI